MHNVYIVSALRTAVGTLGKTLKNTNAVDLGSSVITENIKKLSLNKNELDEVIMGQVLTGGSGQNPARQT